MIQYQGINSLSNLKNEFFFKIMFRIPYPIQIKILIFNQLKIFNSLLSFLLVQFPSFLFLLFNFLVILCSQVFIPSISSKSWMGSWNFSVSLDFSRMGIKLSIFSPYGSYRFCFGEERVFILYIFPYLHLGPPFPLSVLFSSIKSNP